MKQLSVKIERIDTMTTLGEYIARLREEKGWSQRELARRCSQIEGKVISATHIRRLENDEIESPGLKFISVLAKALNVHQVKLVYAFEGKDPDKAGVPEELALDDAFFEAFRDFLKNRGQTE